MQFWLTAGAMDLREMAKLCGKAPSLRCSQIALWQDQKLAPHIDGRLSQSLRYDVHFWFTAGSHGPAVRNFPQWTPLVEKIGWHGNSCSCRYMECRCSGRRG